MHRTGELYGQFETLEQQKESAALGMWVFLSTEVLFFGGLFMTYTLNRHYYGAAFGVGSNTLDLKLGGAEHRHPDSQQFDHGHVRMGFLTSAKGSRPPGFC